MKNNTFVSLAIAAVLTAGLIAAPGTAHAGKNCEDKLVFDSVYVCRVNSSDQGIRTDVLLDFFERGVVGEFFLDTSNEPWSAFEFSCTCLPKGKVDKPKFNAGGEAHCVGESGGDATSLLLKPNGKGTKLKGTGSNHDDNAAYIIECVLDED